VSNPEPEPEPEPYTPLMSPQGGFDVFWARYPRHAARPRAEKAWRRALKLVSAEVILAGLDRQLPELRAREPTMVPHPASWLTDERWADEASSSAGNGHDPYAGWPVFTDCARCGDAHQDGETCPLEVRE
jgi:hypothetical protein